MSVQCDHPTWKMEQCYESLRVNGESWGAGDSHRCHLQDGHDGLHRHECTRGDENKRIVIEWEA